jgi:hypothetical protein
MLEIVNSELPDNLLISGFDQKSGAQEAPDLFLEF